MAIFKVDVQKQFAGESWTNRYLIDQTDLVSASLNANLIVSAERQFHPVQVEFTLVRTSDLVQGTDQFITVPLNLAGLGPNIGDWLPLFNTVRVDFSAGLGRPSRKYYRAILDEGNQTNGTLITELRNTIEGELLNLLENIALVDPQGSPLSNPQVAARVQMRQLRRGSRRRATPPIQP